MVKTIPQMYRFLYDRAERATEVGPFRAWVHQFTAGNIHSLIQGYRPDVVVCTHAFPCGVMAEYKKQFASSPPVFGIVTDYAVHTFWIHGNIDGYAVATQEMASTLAARGVPRDCISVSGIPVKSAFGAECADLRALRERLELPLDRHIVLLMGGGLGIGPLETMMQSLQDVREPICAVAIVGRSSRSEQRVLEYAHRVNYPVRVLRFVDNVHEYMHASDVLITKPGGLTTSEALAARLPMVLFKPLPGQEERNTRYFVKNRAALRAKTAQDLAQNVQSLLAMPENRRQMKAAMKALSKPNAASEIAAAIRNVARDTQEGEAIA